MFSLPWLCHHLCSTFLKQFHSACDSGSSVHCLGTLSNLILGWESHLWGSGNFIFSKDLLDTRRSNMFSLYFWLSHSKLTLIILAAWKGNLKSLAWTPPLWLLLFSHQVMSLLWSYELQHTRLLCPPLSSQSLLKLISIELVMPSNHLTLHCPLLILPQGLFQWGWLLQF